MTRTQSILIFACLAGLAGCRSFSSTALTRMGDNSYVGSSNGNQKLSWQARPFKGVPITLKVPTHLDVYIEEIYYLQEDTANEASVTEPIAGTRLLNVRTELIRTKKVFIVDYKRPGSGTLDTDTTFTDEQYFAKISNQLTDTTITDASKLLQTALTGQSTSAVNGPTAAQLASMASLVRDSRVVAYQRFDINDLDFELQVETFVNQHLNDCDHCGQSPSYDKISQ